MTNWPDLTALELLAAVAEHGSVGAAARSIDMAQPNATRALARLENHVGATLLVRSTRGSSLTPAGDDVLQAARPALAAARDVNEVFRTLGRKDVSESMSVAASQTIAEHLLPIWLSALRRDSPEARIEVHVHNSHDVIDDVREGRVGLGFVEDPSVPKDLRSMIVAKDEMVLVVAPHHVWARRSTPVTAAELAQTPLITREEGSGTRVALDLALPAPATPYLELPSNPAVRVSVASGAAPAVLSRLAVADALAAGTLVTVPLAFPVRRPLRAVWTGRRRLTGARAELVAIAARIALPHDSTPPRRTRP